MIRGNHFTRSAIRTTIRQTIVRLSDSVIQGVPEKAAHFQNKIAPDIITR